MRKMYEKRIIEAAKLLEGRGWPIDSLLKVKDEILIELLGARYCINKECITDDGICRHDVCEHLNFFAKIHEEKLTRKLRKIKVLETRENE